MTGAQISYAWEHPDAAKGFASGVSLHSHTSRSKETLNFLADLAVENPLFRALLRRMEARCMEKYGIPIDYASSYWAPPLAPRQAFELESGQIENQVQLPALVSITDHDTIQAPMLLRTVARARHIPVSVEWTAPFGNDQVFHLGIHNLPSASGGAWMAEFQRYTEHPSPALLTDLLAALDGMPGVLIVFNHPLWDLYRMGRSRHDRVVEDFLSRNGRFIHALEINGLRGRQENRMVQRLAARWGKLLISGGDRHGLEPNANINLTHAAVFNEFVHEIRREKRSHLLFMPQYAQPWKHRIVQSTLDAIRDYPDFPEGSRCWDERIFHPDGDGVDRPLAQLWPTGRAPLALRLGLALVRMMGREPVSRGLRIAWTKAHVFQFVSGEREPF